MAAQAKRVERKAAGVSKAFACDTLPSKLALVYLNWRAKGNNRDQTRIFEGLPWKLTERRGKEAYVRLVQDGILTRKMYVTAKGVEVL